jgi:glycogen debranching enzyme
MDRGLSEAPVHYPVSCIPQAWAAGAMFMMLQAVTGILPDAHEGCVHVRTPQLPAFLRELTVSRLRVGRSEVSMRFVRDNGRTIANLLAVDGEPLRVVIEV